MTALDLNK